MVLKSTTKTKLLLSTLMALTIGVGVVNQHESVVRAEEKNTNIIEDITQVDAEKVTSLDQITDSGLYYITKTDTKDVDNSKNVLSSFNTSSSNYFYEMKNNGTNALVLHFNFVEQKSNINYYTISQEDNNNKYYIGITKDANCIDRDKSASGDNYKWKIEIINKDTGEIQITNASTTYGGNRMLQANSDGSRFACYKNTQPNVNIYKINTNFTVTFDAAGGVLNSKKEVLVEPNKNLSRPVDPSWEGHIFKGWFYNEVEWNFDTDVVKSDMTLKAKWANLYTITFNTNANGDETLVFESDSEVQVEEGNMVSMPVNSPNRAEYIFQGWYESLEAANAFDSNDTFDFDRTPIRENKTLYAGWKKAQNTYTVHFDSNGGNPVGDKKVLEGGWLIPEEVITSRENYEFVGWFTEDDVKWNVEGYQGVESDMTLKAKWNHFDAEFFSYTDATTKMSVGYEKRKESKEILLAQYSFDSKITHNDSIDASGVLELFKNNIVSGDNIVNEKNGVITAKSIYGNTTTQGPTDAGGLRLGTSSVNGELKLSLTKPITKVVVYARTWSTTSTETLNVNYLGGKMAGQNSSAKLEFNLSEVNEIIFTSNKRVVIQTIEFYSDGESEVFDFTSATIAFGTILEKEVYHEDATYGMFLVNVDENTKDLVLDLETLDTNRNYELNWEEVNSVLSEKGAKTKKYEKSRVTSTDEYGSPVEEGEYYTYGIKFGDMLPYIDNELIAVGYMEFEGKLYFNQQTQYSLRSLAQAYKDGGYLNDNEDAQMILDMLINYGLEA